jgi:small subunit ribosomal protein S17
MGPSNRKIREGVVVSTKMQKTAVIKVSRTFSHPRYEKSVIEAKKYYAHNELENLKEGDRVRIEETRPLSKLKRWIVREVL